MIVGDLVSNRERIGIIVSEDEEVGYQVMYGDGSCELNYGWELEVAK